MSYDEDDQTLEIEFTRGGTYVYRGIPQPLAEGLKRAESPGRYLDRFIKPNYLGRRV